MPEAIRQGFCQKESRKSQSVYTLLPLVNNWCTVTWELCSFNSYIHGQWKEHISFSSLFAKYKRLYFACETMTLSCLNLWAKFMKGNSNRYNSSRWQQLPSFWMWEWDSVPDRCLLSDHLFSVSLLYQSDLILHTDNLRITPEQMCRDCNRSVKSCHTSKFKTCS